MYEYRATLRRVVDGDTVDLDVDLGFHLRTLLRFRLAGIDAPEPRTETRAAGQAASEFLRALLDGKALTIRTMKQGKYGRWLAEIYYTDGVQIRSVNQEMVTRGHAVRAG